MNIQLRYESSKEGVIAVLFESWEEADAYGHSLNFDKIEPNVETSRLIPRGWEYESGVFDRHHNCFAVISKLWGEEEEE